MDGMRFSEQEIWEKYLEVTKDLLKFINDEDIDTFLELVNQRQQLMEMLKKLPSHEYANTPAGKEIRKTIEPMDREIMFKARSWLNKSKRNNMAVKSYDITSFMPAGNMFNKEY